jgi:alkanesulfonate monooxygenase SsuD/methylene tetrahydromethanopterin reductase-like flavin-dependent oxidoreductase (luciferase family)
VIDMTAPDIGVLLPTMTEPGQAPGDVAAAARHAEQLGLESVWAVDQLISGSGAPILDSGLALAAAATATERITLGYGVMILPLRPVAWAAKQVATLQHLSGGRVLFGVGAGGDRHDRSWDAVGVSQRERGRRTDAALRSLPGLIAGEPTQVDTTDGGDGPTVQLSPAAPVPPIVVGGMSEAAMVRAATYADGWYALPAPPAALAEAGAQLAGLATARGRPTPTVSTAILAAITGDRALPPSDQLVRKLTDPDGAYGIPEEALGTVLIDGRPDEVAIRLAELGDAGVTRAVASFAAGDWFRQTELLAEAHALAS